MRRYPTVEKVILFKQDLLSVAPGKDKDAPFLFVESVELELQVTVKRTTKAGAKGVSK